MVPLLLLCASLVAGDFLAGAAKVDCTVPIGAPLAGINHGARRVPDWPLPRPTAYTTWMTPSRGRWPGDGTYCRALTLRETGSNTSVTFVTVDAIGALGHLRRNAVRFARGLGFSTPDDNVILSGSHSHSGPGGIASDFLWSIAPATDLEIPVIAEGLALKLATVMAESEKNLQPARVDAGSFDLIGVTKNRRCHISPYLNCSTIDPHLGVMRVDDMNGKLMAVTWNFAMHGTCLGSDNLKFSGDIMGRSSLLLEEQTGAIVMFQNADAGDIDPDYSLCKGDPSTWTGPAVFAAAVRNASLALQPVSTGSLSAVSKRVNFGPVVMNLTLARLGDNCSNAHGGELDLCDFCKVIPCHLDPPFQSGWIENTPLFTAVRLDVNNKRVGMVTMPGEALLQLGWQIRNDTQAMGYEVSFLLGYSQAHLGYFATEREYEVGGYESQLTLWGIGTAKKVRSSAFDVASKLATAEMVHDKRGK